MHHLILRDRVFAFLQQQGDRQHQEGMDCQSFSIQQEIVGDREQNFGVSLVEQCSPFLATILAV